MIRRTKVCAAVTLAFTGTMVVGVAPAFGQQQQLDRVEITGSSIRRPDAETSLPVTIVTRTEIERSGVANTEQLLQSLTAVSAAGGTNNAMGAGNSTYGTSTVSLRGLGEDRTLVLVNGRRLAPFAGGNGASINVNAIPLSAIERVEVLKDGASGVYGSDAIAGVVNFILRSNFEGIELGATVGSPTRSGGGRSTRATIVGGFGDLTKDRLSITVSGSVEKETALFAKDRKFAKTGNVDPYISATATGQGNIQGSYLPGTGVPTQNAKGEFIETGKPGPTVRAKDDNGNPAFNDDGSPKFVNQFGNTTFGNPLAAANNCASVNMFRATDSSVGAPRCLFDSNSFVGLVPERQLADLSANIVFKVSDGIELFSDALYSRSKVTQTFQPSPVRRDFLQSDTLFAERGIDPVLVIRPGNPAYDNIAVPYLNAQEAANPGVGFADIIGKPIAITSRVFDFGNRTSVDTATQTRIVAGTRGTLLNQDFEVAAASSKSKLEGTVTEGYFSQTAFAQAVNAPGSDYNPWTLNQSAAFNSSLAATGAKYVGPTLNSLYKTNALDAKVSGDIVKLPAGALQYAAGVQFRKENLLLAPSAALLTGDIAGLGGATRPVDKSRKVGSVFTELVVPIVKGLEANLAYRFDKYSIVGNTSNYKTSMRFQPVPEATLRVSYGTGFRAPTLRDLYDPLTLGSTEQFNDPKTKEVDLQVNSFTGGYAGLKPEKSRQSSIGIVMQPVPTFTFSVDYFSVKVSDLIAQESAQSVVNRNFQGDPSYANLVTRSSGGSIETITQLLRNVGTATVNGFDLEASYKENMGGGRLDLNLAGTYMLQFDQTSPSGSLSKKVGTLVEPDGTPVLSTSSTQDGVVLQWKHVASATWTQNSWSYTIAQNYYSGYRDGNDLNDEPHYVPSQALYDINVGYNGIKGLRLALGVKNVFDKDPPLHVPTSNQFQAGYDISQYDPRARFVYLSAAYKF
jgi:iron complex outermembrane receptor protein